MRIILMVSLLISIGLGNSIGQKNSIVISVGAGFPWGHLSDMQVVKDNTSPEPGPIIGISYIREFWKGGGPMISFSASNYAIDQTELIELDQMDPSFTIIESLSENWRNMAILVGLSQKIEIGRSKKIAIGFSGQIGFFFANTIDFSYLDELNSNSQQIVSFSGNTSISFAADLGTYFDYKFGSGVSARLMIGYRIGGATNEIQTLDLPQGINKFYSEDITVQAINLQIGLCYKF